MKDYKEKFSPKFKLEIDQKVDAIQQLELDIKFNNNDDQLNDQLDDYNRQEGNFEIGDKIHEIISYKILPDTQEFLLKVTWKQRKNGINPLPSLLKAKEIKFYQPNKLIKFYEKKIIKLEASSGCQKMEKMEKSETIIFTKNVKQSVQSKELWRGFEKFGEIVNCVLKEPGQKKNMRFKPTQFGYIFFANENDAKNVLLNAINDIQLQAFYESGNVYYQKQKSHKTQIQEIKIENSRPTEPIIQKKIESYPENKCQIY